MTHDEARLVAEELRAAFAEERRAICALDTAALERLTILKQRCCARLEQLAATGPDPVLKQLLGAVRAEARANAALARIAADAVRVVLGVGPAPTYDRRARTAAPTTQPLRLLATL